MANSFSRSELILGHDAMQKLAAARVAVFGVGGVGGALLVKHRKENADEEDTE